METFNKRGDGGETSLMYGVRVRKSHLRCEAYGTIDEVVSTIGLARAFCKRVPAEALHELQRQLFTVGAELATTADHYDKITAKGTVVTPEMVDALQKRIEEYEARMDMPRAFIVPGAVAGAAALDMARSTLRRAERRVVSLVEAGEVQNPEVQKYLNRLADLLFTLARFEEGEARLYV